MRTPGSILAIALVASLLPSGAPAVAAEAKRIGTFDAWSAFSFGDGQSKLCYVHSVPESSDGDYTRRGETYVQITHRPAEKSLNVIGITAGYVYKPGSEAEVEIDGNKHTLFTNGDGAWARDAKGDAALVAAMKAGNTMIVRGTSTRGTLTIDTYSLRGFTAAHNAINKACGVR